METTTEKMLRTTPNHPRGDRNSLGTCIDACHTGEIACVSCADACLGEDDIDPLRACIRLNLDCADVCAATARICMRLFGVDTDLLRAQLDLCARACAACAVECERHLHHAHCEACAAACRNCETACLAVLATMIAYEAAVP